MKETIKNIKVGEIPDIITKLGLSPEQTIDLTIENSASDLISVFNRIGKEAQEKGLTPEKLAELLADKS